MMKNKIVALGLSVFTAFAGIGMLLGESKALSANAEEEITETASAQITATESTTATSTLTMPSLEKGKDKEHYCLAAYTFKQNDTAGTSIGFKRGANEQYDAFSLDVKYGKTANYVVVSSGEEGKCIPTCQVCRAYNSAKTVTSDYCQDLRNADNYLLAQYTATGKTSAVGSYMPTSWDETGYVWEHGGSSGNYIYYSIAYKGTIADRIIEIPWIGYTTSAGTTIGDMTFYVRTGPNKISIKAYQSGVYCNSYDTMFAFYAVD